MRACDELLADFRHRKLEVEDEAAGARLRPFFAAAGWVIDRNAVMRREGPGRPHADVEEVALADTQPLRIEWYLTYDNDAGDAGAIVSAEDRISVRRGMRAFVVRDARRSPVGFTLLAATEGEDAAEIDQLYVTPDAPLTRGSAGGWWRPRWPRADATWRGSSPTTRARRARSTSGSASSPSGASTRSSASPRDRAGEPAASGLAWRTRLTRAGSADAAPAGEVRRGALVAAEGGVGDDPRVPGERLVRRDLDGEVRAPARCPRRRGRRARRA